MIENTIDVIKILNREGCMTFSIQVTVLECQNQTLTVKGLPGDFSTWKVKEWQIAGTDINIIDYMGTYELGLLYLSRPVSIEIGKCINLIN